jgi:anaphase-promoting complex subunit 5
VSQQAYLIENNEYESLLPADLHQKIDELFNYESIFPDVFYLKYLNSLRIKDYSVATKYMHDYFDRFIIHGSIPLAALNLVSLEYRFSNR